jgi:hypothetical protein
MLLYPHMQSHLPPIELQQGTFEKERGREREPSLKGYSPIRFRASPHFLVLAKYRSPRVGQIQPDLERIQGS